MSPASATIPAGGTSKITITYDPTAGLRGTYGGAIQVNGADEDTSLRISVGANKIPPSHLLRIHTVKPDHCDSPRYISSCAEFVVLMPVDSPGDFTLLWPADDQQVLVPDGVYAVTTGFKGYYDPRTGAGITTMLLDPEVKVDGADQEIPRRARRQAGHRRHRAPQPPGFHRADRVQGHHLRGQLVDLAEH